MIEILKRAAAYPIRYVPWFRKKFWIHYYNLVTRVIPDEDFVYMNLGYASSNGRTKALDLEDPSQLHRFSDELYRHVSGAVNLEGLDILEIGCGRGGGSAYLMEHSKPRTLTAVDISGEAIECCKHRYSMKGLTFKRADAESLPFADRSFDAVICIESSHCFSSRACFLAEAVRVLRPRGYFFFADLINPLFDQMPIEELQELFRHAGLDRLKAENISANVFKARGLLSASSLYREHLARWARSNGRRNRFMSSIFCLRGTPSFERLRRGEMQYWCWTLQKPG